MTDLLVHELRAWLRLAGVNERGRRALTGARELFWLAQDTGMGASDALAARRLFQRLDLQIGDGDLWRRLANHLDPLPRAGPTHAFLRQVSQIAPSWLSKSPGASSGRFELFYRMTRPGCGWPKRGDVLDRGQIVEIKGLHGQLTHPRVTGDSHHTKSLVAFGPRGFEPNSSRVRAVQGTPSFEIIKPYVHAHYAAQFHARPVAAAEAIAAYLHSLPALPEERCMAVAAGVLGNGESFGENLRRIWLEVIYEENRHGEGAMDRLIVFGDGSNVKVIDHREDLTKLQITGVGLRTGRPDRLSLRVN